MRKFEYFFVFRKMLSLLTSFDARNGFSLKNETWFNANETHITTFFLFLQLHKKGSYETQKILNK